MRTLVKLPEVWAGLECTIARVGDAYRDQIKQTGHRDRPDDLDAIHELGIRTLRYPVLWETVAPDHPDQCDWSWTDERVARLRRLAFRPILGLLHHGSGPRYTSLLDPNLPELLARHAGRVAARYPWVDLYTPVNEPLTTARFSALYGHWYPHAGDTRSFVHAVVIQCKAVVLAMRAIRQVNTRAQLVQTEDIGKTFSTPPLKAQADYENIRRWLSLDLLCGRVDSHHPWYGSLQDQGISQADLELFREGDAAPDIIGINHYLTSERYLDGATDRYPDHLQGGNGQQTFADAEAVRVELSPHDLGPAARLAEVWARFGRPIAVTEVHHGCTRDEQLRWLAEVWQAVLTLRNENVDIRAVTVWAMFGTFDWNSLLTEQRGFYEPGAFDVRAPRPRLTALGRAAASLARTGTLDHPVLDTQGWWRRAERLYVARGQAEPPVQAARTLVLTGPSTSLTRAFQRICAVRGLRHAVLGQTLDLARVMEPEGLRGTGCWAVIDTGSEAQRSRTEMSSLARHCADADLPFVSFSADRVFDGRLGRPYVETDDVCPADLRGHLLLAHERDIGRAHHNALLVRTGPVFDAVEADDVLVRLFQDLAAGSCPPMPDIVVSPTYAPDLVHAVLDLLIDGEEGLWHLANVGEIGMPDLAVRLALSAGVRPPPDLPASRERGGNFALASRRGWPMPSLDDALSRFIRDISVGQPHDARLAAE